MKTCVASQSLRACVLVMLAGLPLGCDGEGETCAAGTCAEPDGSIEDAASPEVPWLEAGLPSIAPPVLTSCPDGWHEVAPAAGAPPTCDPYPASGALDCPDGQAHFPGEPGCSPIGAPCPPGDFNAALPVDRRVVYVRPGATMGDGSEARPWGSLSEFGLGGLPMGSVIALSRGAHDGPVRLSRQNGLAGACAEATSLRATEPSELEGVVTFVGAGGIRDLTLANSPRPAAWLVGAGASGSIDGVIVEGVQYLAVAVGDGALLSMQTVVVRDTQSRPDGSFGRALTVQQGATANVSRAVFSENRDLAIASSHTGTTLQLSDAVVEDTSARTSDGTRGRALSAQLGGMLDVNGILLERNRELAVFAGGEGTSLRMSDVVVRDTLEQSSDGQHGRGIGVELGASGDVSRAHVHHNRDIGVLTLNEGSALRLSDVVVRSTMGRADDGTSGIGLDVEQDATAEVARAFIANNRDGGAFANRAALSMSDVVIRDTEGREADGQLGRGMSVQIGAVVDVTRAHIDRSREGGAIVLAATLDLEDVVVSDTRARACADTTCADATAGHGVGCYYPGTTVRMTRFAIRRSHLCGVHLARDAELDLAAGEVRGNEIGSCLQVEGYDVERLTTAVTYEDNGVSLQTTSLPVPDPPM